MRKFNFWNGRSQRVGKKQRRLMLSSRRRQALMSVNLAVESLEDRNLLAANPLLSIGSNQFFAQNAPISEFAVPLRATFTDEADSTPQTFSASIDWGDGSPIDTDATVLSRVHSPIFAAEAAGDPITGRIEARHSYADVGSYTVTITLTDDSAIAAPATTGLSRPKAASGMPMTL